MWKFLSIRTCKKLLNIVTKQPSKLSHLFLLISAWFFQTYNQGKLDLQTVYPFLFGLDHQKIYSQIQWPLQPLWFAYICPNDWPLQSLQFAYICPEEWPLQFHYNLSVWYINLWVILMTKLKNLKHYPFCPWKGFVKTKNHFIGPGEKD